MEEAFKQIALSVALATEAAAVLIIAIGTLQAIFALLKYGISPKRIAGTRKEIWMGLAIWLLLGLEFELAADIVRSVVSPQWADIGSWRQSQSSRTFLNISSKRTSKSTVSPTPEPRRKRNQRPPDGSLKPLHVIFTRTYRIHSIPPLILAST